jgi:protein SCO1/2
MARRSASPSRSTEVARSLALILAVSACVACGSSHAAPAPGAAPSFRGDPTLHHSVAADFALVDQHGRRVRLSAQRGKVVLLTFLYTSCPDVCPLTAAKLGIVARTLGSLSARLRILAVSVDPTGDTHANVARFVAKFNLPLQFHYLTGSRRTLQPVWQSYNVLVERRNLERVDQSFPTIAIVSEGRPRVYFTTSATPAAIEHDVRILLRRS